MTLVDTSHGQIAQAVRQAEPLTLDGLLEGVFARMPGVAPLDRCIRISAAPIHELDVFEDALPRALAALSPA